MSRVEFFDGEFYAKVEDAMADRLTEVGELVTDTLRDRLSVEYPPASLPGDYPAMRTGDLRDSVVYEVNAAEGWVEMGAEADYAEELVGPYFGRLMTSHVVEDLAESIAYLILPDPDVPF